MAIFKAINPDVEVNGQTVLSLVNGLGSFKSTGLRILDTHGIRNIKDDEWYCQQDWLNAFKYINEKIGAGSLFMIGKSIPANTNIPPKVQSIITNVYRALAATDYIYHMNHRLNGKILFDPATGKMSDGIGNYHYKRFGEKHIEIKCDNPYPCDFDKGIITQMANMFKPDNAYMIIEHDKTLGCRNHGDESCTYSITW